MNKTVGRITQEVIIASTWMPEARTVVVGMHWQCHGRRVSCLLSQIYCFLIGWEYILPHLFSAEAVPQEARHRAMKSMCRTSADSMNPCSRQGQSLARRDRLAASPMTSSRLHSTSLGWDSTEKDMKGIPDDGLHTRWMGREQLLQCFPSDALLWDVLQGLSLYVSIKVDLEPRRVLHRWICLWCLPFLWGYSTGQPINTRNFRWVTK